MQGATIVLVVSAFAAASPLASQTSAAHADDDEYAVIMQAECKKLGIPFPIPKSELSSDGGRAFVEQALEETFSRGALYGDVKFGFKKDSLVLWFHPRPVRTTYFGNNPELAQSAISASRDADILQREAPSRIRRTVLLAFEAPPDLLMEVPPVDSRYALQALGGVDFETAALTVTTISRINVLATWSRVIDKARTAGWKIDRELPLDTSTGKRALKTALTEEADGEWIYQMHYEISMWDPSFGRDRNRIGRELRLSASLIASRRRRSGGESTTITRSGPAQQPVVVAIMREITRQ